MITVKYFAPLRGVLGVTEESLDADTVQGVLKHIKESYGKAGYKAAKSALIVVNDVSIGQLSEMKTKLADGDTVGFLPICGGG